MRRAQRAHGRRGRRAPPRAPAPRSRGLPSDWMAATALCTTQGVGVVQPREQSARRPPGRPMRASASQAAARTSGSASSRQRTTSASALLWLTSGSRARRATLSPSRRAPTSAASAWRSTCRQGVARRPADRGRLAHEIDQRSGPPPRSPSMPSTVQMATFSPGSAPARACASRRATAAASTARAQDLLDGGGDRRSARRTRSLQLGQRPGRHPHVGGGRARRAAGPAARPRSCRRCGRARAPPRARSAGCRAAPASGRDRARIAAAPQHVDGREHAEEVAAARPRSAAPRRPPGRRSGPAPRSPPPPRCRWRGRASRTSTGTRRGRRRRPSICATSAATAGSRCRTSGASAASTVAGRGHQRVDRRGQHRLVAAAARQRVDQRRQRGVAQRGQRADHGPPHRPARIGQLGQRGPARPPRPLAIRPIDVLDARLLGLGDREGGLVRRSRHAGSMAVPPGRAGRPGRRRAGCRWRRPPRPAWRWPRGSRRCGRRRRRPRAPAPAPPSPARRSPLATSRRWPRISVTASAICLGAARLLGRPPGRSSAMALVWRAMPPLRPATASACSATARAVCRAMRRTSSPSLASAAAALVCSAVAC